MLLFNSNAINSFLLFILLFTMLGYFIARSEKNREVTFLTIFIAQLVIWQFCFFIRNIYFDPVAAYPLFYFLHSGYTFFSYLALAMFSYYFVEPVFQRESRVVLLIGSLATIAIAAYFFFIVFPGEIKVYLDPVLHVYEAETAPHRKMILFGLLILILITLKNLIYKSIILRGEQRTFVLNITAVLIMGVMAVVGVSLVHQYYPIHPNIHNTINTYLSGFLFIYFYLVYLSYSKMRFLYFDKTMLMIFCTVTIIIILTMSLSYQFYEREYIGGKQEMADRIAIDFQRYRDAGSHPDHIGSLYSNEFRYLVTREADGGALKEVYWDPEKLFFAENPLNSQDVISPQLQTIGDHFFYCFKSEAEQGILHAGVPYLQFREHIHSFVKAGFFMILIILAMLFVFIRLVIFIGLTGPLKQLLSGIREIRGGNLNHRIDISAQDEIGYIAQQFNLMVDDLNTSGETIKKSERKFRELTKMLPDIVYETDPDLKLTYFNEAGYQLTGYTEEDFQRGFYLTDILDDKEIRRLQKMIREKDDGSHYGLTAHHILRKNGEVLLGENNAAVVIENYKLIGLRGVMRDVTEKIRVEASLFQAQKMETIGTLAGGIAHDFNNILTGITGTVSLMELKAHRNGSLTPAEMQQDLGILKRSADRATGLIKQLLTLSRKGKPVLQMVDLNIAAQNVYEICKNTFDKIIDVRFDYLENEAHVMADETQMVQALLNLCINARDSMTLMRPEWEEQSGVLSVTVGKIEPEDLPANRDPEVIVQAYLRLRVADTGIGMDSDTISRIFDPFFTTKRKNEGTGLGMAMVYTIMEQHGGFIAIQSALSVGTTIDLYIPAFESESVLPHNETDDMVVAAGCGTILLIDDDPIVQGTCSEMLSALGCHVITAMNGHEGVVVYKARQHEIDGVILDLEMPVMSGNEALAALKAIDPDVKVLVSSGFREDPRIDEMIESGILGFIQKPYCLKELSLSISQFFTTCESGTHSSPVAVVSPPVEQ